MRRFGCPRSSMGHISICRSCCCMDLLQMCSGQNLAEDLCIGRKIRPWEPHMLYGTVQRGMLPWGMGDRRCRSESATASSQRRMAHFPSTLEDRFCPCCTAKRQAALVGSQPCTEARRYLQLSCCNSACDDSCHRPALGTAPPQFGAPHLLVLAR